jgi:carbamoyltransferase
MCNRIGLTESEDLASASVLGNPYRFYKSLLQDFIMRMPDHRSPTVLFNRDFLKIAENWRQELQSQQDLLDIAAAVQMLFQDLLDRICRFVAENFSSKNLILCGDIATNPIANNIAYKYFDSVHIPVDPTDAGSALGAVLLKTKTHIDFHRPFVGYNIDRPYSNSDVIFNLATEGVVGVANGAAEFGSKSLGNRSLLADPRQQNIKQKIVDIKQQQFESFSPAILEEYVDEYFYGPTSPYQQYTAKCRNPDQFPAVVDRDGVSTVQTVSKKDNARFRNLLERWHQETGCPMLLNTSLNIQGEPIVNTWEDAKTFSNTCGVKVF